MMDREISDNAAMNGRVMRYAFCTYFDSNYLPRGLALIESLRRWCQPFDLWVLCLDDQTTATISQISDGNIHALPVDELERWCPELASARADRSLVEFYFTCTPSLPLYVLERNPDVDLITYLDADTYFFASPATVFEEIADRSIAIVEHGYAPRFQDLVVYGTYNVGWVTFRRDRTGLACLRQWQQQCIEWCFDRLEDGRYADQLYLDDWPTRFEGVAVLQHRGVNVAPWNLANLRVHTRNGQIRIDDDPLVLFHFHGFKQVGQRLYDTHTDRYNTGASRLARRMVFRPYIRAIAKATEGQMLPAGVREPTRSQSPVRLSKRPMHLARITKRLFRGQYVMRVVATTLASDTIVEMVDVAAAMWPAYGFASTTA